LQSQDAADVLQNVFMSVIRGVERFTFDRPDASFRGWLRIITRNAVLQHVRQRRADIATMGGSKMQALLNEQPDLSELEGDSADLQSLTSLTHRALEIVRERVDARVWDAFWRTTVGQESAPEVAAELGMTSTAVRQAKFRVLCKLRDLLADR